LWFKEDTLPRSVYTGIDGEKNPEKKLDIERYLLTIEENKRKGNRAKMDQGFFDKLLARIPFTTEKKRLRNEFKEDSEKQFEQQSDQGVAKLDIRNTLSENKIKFGTFHAEYPDPNGFRTNGRKNH